MERVRTVHPMIDRETEEVVLLYHAHLGCERSILNAEVYKFLDGATGIATHFSVLGYYEHEVWNLFVPTTEVEQKRAASAVEFYQRYLDDTRDKDTYVVRRAEGIFSLLSLKLLP